MLKQITMLEALQRITKGETIRCLLPGATETWGDYSPTMLNDYLVGVIPFAEEEDPEPAKREIDAGKIYALADAGWDIKKIADEMGCSSVTVRNWLKRRDN